MYHVGLALEPEQVKQLRQQALESDKTVRDYVTDLVLDALAAKSKNKSGSENKKEAQ